MWDHTAIAADSKLIMSLVVGKRTQAQTRALVHDAKRRLRPGHLPAIFTDAYEGYESALLEAFGRRYPVPRLKVQGRAPRSVLRWPQGLAYGQVKKHYQKGRVERIEVRALYGKARLKQVLYLLGYNQYSPIMRSERRSPWLSKSVYASSMMMKSWPISWSGASAPAYFLPRPAPPARLEVF